MDSNTQNTSLRQVAGQKLFERLAREHAARRRRTDLRHYAVAAVVLAALAIGFLTAPGVNTANSRPNAAARVKQATTIINSIIETT